MAALDFKEIPPAQKGLERDQFELFARDCLGSLGFRIVDNPDRGPDNGRDLIVEEQRIGPGGASVVRWLVSCKHKAHSGTSVTPADEANIRDRLETHDCTGFIAFYSTVPSSGLGTTLRSLRPKFELMQLDQEAIEGRLLSVAPGRAIAARYMPNSFSKWIQASHAVEQIAPPPPDPDLINNSFFLRPPHCTLRTAQEEAGARGVPVFAVVYDPDHPTHSKLRHSLGYFMSYQTVKRLVDENFVPVIGPSTEPEFGQLVPKDDPLENCLWIVMDASGNILRREGVYANSDEGLKRVREVIETTSKA